MREFLTRHDWIALTLLIALPFVFFWQVTLGYSVWMTADILRVLHPFGVELARALDAGRLPLWTDQLSAGFPLFAEGQVAALYPIKFILYKILPPHLALAYAVLVHLALAGAGMYFFLRAHKVTLASAFLAGVIFTLSGVMQAQIFHPPIVFAMAWLPWTLFFLTRSLTPSTREAQARWFAATAVALSMQFLCGSAQIALLNTIAVGIVGVAGKWLWSDERWNGRAFAQNILLIGALVVAGAGVAAVQLLPTFELVNYSVRSGGVFDKDYIATYALPPEKLLQFVSPFASGEPSEANLEYLAYFGSAPFILACLAPFVCRDRRTIFFALFALAMLALAFGPLNPVYDWLAQLPVLNSFRVAARYLHLVVFASACLSAFALDAWRQRNPATHTPKLFARLPLVVSAIAVLAIVALGNTQPLAVWLAAWRWLPMVFSALALGAIGLAWKKWMRGDVFAACLVGLTLIDLSCYQPPFWQTLNPLTPASTVTALPRSLAALNPVLAGARVYTDDSIFPSPPAIRASLFPNTALTYNHASTQIHSPLAFGAHEAYVADMSPAMLNLLAARYVMIPLEPRAVGKSLAPAGSLAQAVIQNEIVIAPTQAQSIQVVSFIEQGAQLPDGTLAGTLQIRYADDSRTEFPLRLGSDTASWDYERFSASDAIAHQRASLARIFPAFWRSLGRPFEGHVYATRFQLKPIPIVGIAVRPASSEVQLVIEDILLDDQYLATLAGINRFTLAYLSDTAAAWENHDALPRAFIVHRAHIASGSEIFAELKRPAFDPAQLVWLEAGGAIDNDARATNDSVQMVASEPMRVELIATTDQPGYLVLADSWYPGWEAHIDGRAAQIERADILFRAVWLDAGVHRIIFEYRPLAFVIGAGISIISILTLIGAVVYFQRRKP